MHSGKGGQVVMKKSSGKVVRYNKWGYNFEGYNKFGEKEKKNKQTNLNSSTSPEVSSYDGVISDINVRNQIQA
jgi:hypothetical protein